MCFFCWLPGLVSNLAEASPITPLRSLGPTSLRFRIAGYVVEVKDCKGPAGAAPHRVYYARTKEQRKARHGMRLYMHCNWLPASYGHGTIAKPSL